MFTQDDPFSVCMIERKLKQGHTVMFSKGQLGCCQATAQVRRIQPAFGSYKSNLERDYVPGYYSLVHTRGAETLTAGECRSLKFRAEGDTIFVHLPPCV